MNECLKAVTKRPHIMSPRCIVAIITGGTRGVGLATATRLLSEGADGVVISGLEQKEGCIEANKLRRAYGPEKVIFRSGDVCDPDHITELFELAMTCYKKVDILFNNAGIMSDNNWEREIDINIKGVLNGCQTAFQYMGKNNGGNGGLIVNTGSVSSFGPLNGVPVYSATKHATVNITRNYGHPFYYDETGIRVLSLCPGMTNTVHFSGTLYQQYNKEWGEEAVKTMLKQPTQHVGVVARAFMYLIRYAPTATHWIIEDYRLYCVDVPDIDNLVADETQFFRKMGISKFQDS